MENVWCTQRESSKYGHHQKITRKGCKSRHRAMDSSQAHLTPAEQWGWLRRALTRCLFRTPPLQKAHEEKSTLKRSACVKEQDGNHHASPILLFGLCLTSLLQHASSCHVSSCRLVHSQSTISYDRNQSASMRGVLPKPSFIESCSKGSVLARPTSLLAAA